jgi:MtN3 and saliva related transmembrane protein
MDQKLIEIVGLVAGILTASSLLPQLFKTIKTRQAEDVAPYMFWMLVTGTGLWAYYGILRNDLPIVITNAFSFSLNIVMLILRKRYTKKD